MKKNKILTLILTVWLTSSLQGCGGEDNSDKVKKDFAADQKELDEPSIGGDNINFGPKYNGLINQATLNVNSSLSVQAFFDSFVLVQSQEVNLRLLSADILGTGIGSLPEGTKHIKRGTCTGTSLFSRKNSAQATIFDNRLEFLSYCTEKFGFTWHVTELGKITGYGDQDPSNYLMRLYDYRYAVESSSPFSIRMGGEVIVDTSGSQNTLTLRQMVINKNTNNLTARYESWKVTQTSTGTLYNGTLYHPTYGKVIVSTEPNNYINSTEVNGVRRPSSGKIKLTGANSTIGYITFQDVNNYILEATNGVTAIYDPKSW